MLYNTYRPKTFDDVSGQEITKRILQNNIKNNNIPNAPSLKYIIVIIIIIKLTTTDTILLKAYTVLFPNPLITFLKNKIYVSTPI